MTLDPALESEGIGDDTDNFDNVFGEGHGGLPQQQGIDGESDGGGLQGAKERALNRQKERKEAMQSEQNDSLLRDFDAAENAEEEVQEPTDADVDEPDDEPEPDASVQEPETPEPTEDTASKQEASPLDAFNLGDVGAIIKNGMEKKKNQSNG